jgi:pteridine reductase
MGAEMARHLAARGWRLLLHWNRSQEEAEALREELGRECVHLLQADLSLAAGRRRLVAQVLETLGEAPLHLLIHNASHFPQLRLEELDDDAFDALFCLHVKTPLLLSRDLAPRLARGQGLILSMLDAGADWHWPAYLPYALSKQALRDVTIALARQLAPDVRVNGIEPGFILPPEAAPDSYRLAEAQRLTRAAGGPPHILKALDYLLGAEFVTGEILTVDGGRRWIRPSSGAQAPLPESSPNPE